MFGRHAYVFFSVAEQGPTKVVFVYCLCLVLFLQQIVSVSFPLAVMRSNAVWCRQEESQQTERSFYNGMHTVIHLYSITSNCAMV